MRVHIANEARFRIVPRMIKDTIRHAFTILKKEKGWRTSHTLFSVIFVSPERMKELGKYLGKKKPTNVLSFDIGEEAELYLCPAVIAREAASAHIPFLEHLKRLLIHGLIHLTGIHHEKSAHAEKKFRRIEQKLTANLDFRR